MRFLFKLIASLGCAASLTTTLWAGEFSTHLNHPLTITDMNGSWFGLGGDPNNELGNETRVQTLHDFLQNNALLSDVMVFEEIVDIDLFTGSVLDNQYSCNSYERTDPKHQHIVICVKPEFSFDVADDSSSYTIDAVDLNGHLRPAVHGILKTQDGTHVAHIFGVHLKAIPDKSAVRLQQTQIIANYLKRQTVHDPVIILGDFNTFGTDVVNIQNQFKVDGLVELNPPEAFTWSSVKENFAPAKLDRVWISKTLLPKVQSTHVIGPCNGSTRATLAIYNETVSDHCPTKIVISP